MLNRRVFPMPCIVIQRLPCDGVSAFFERQFCCHKNCALSHHFIRRIAEEVAGMRVCAMTRIQGGDEKARV